MIITIILNSIKLFFFITPLVGLVASSIFLDYKSTLKISLVLLVVQFISLFIQSLFVRVGAEKWNFIKFLIDIPILASAYYIYPLIPDGAMEFYNFCFQWIFPVLIYTVESYQGVLLIVYKSRSLISNNSIYSSNNETKDFIFKSFVIIISILSYIISFYIIYQIFTKIDISTLNSCLLSSLGTLMLLLIPYMIMVEESTIIEISLLTVMISLNLYSFFFSFNIGSILSMENILKSLSFLVTFFLISYQLIIGNVGGDDDYDSNIGGSNEESILLKLKSKIIHIILIISLTYLPLSITGTISNSNLLFRYVQGVFTVLCYFYSSNSNNGDDTFKYKYD